MKKLCLLTVLFALCLPSQVLSSGGSEQTHGMECDESCYRIEKESDCPTKVFRSGIFEGILLEMTEVDGIGYNKVQLDNGEVFQFLCGAEEEDNLYGTRVGERMTLPYDYVQIWNFIGPEVAVCAHYIRCDPDRIQDRSEPK